MDIYKCPIHNVLYIPIINRMKELAGWAIASIEDYDILAKYNFHMYKRKDGKCYANAKVDGLEISMHQLIMGKAEEGQVIDHINGSGLDNRKGNLRFATLSQNAQNREKEEGKYSSDYSGVSTCENEGKYRATISYLRKYIHIGTYNSEIEAAKAYDIYAIHYYGLDAKTNKLLSKEEIEIILKNGIPNEYKKKKRELPKNIYHRYNTFSYDLSRDGKRYYKSFKTLEEAILAKDELIASLNKAKEEQTAKNITEITRNKDGMAIIYMYNRNGDNVGECIVDDQVWRDLAKYKWCLRDDGYASGYINKTSILMHIYLYTKYVGEIILGNTIDHINCITLDNRLSNIRSANKSLQSHNRDKIVGSICKYNGVTISGNRFATNSFGERHSFEYMEDAARKYNELATAKYGKDANLNIIDDTVRTTIYDLVKDEITEDYIRNIKFVEQFKLLVKMKNWGGRNGHFSTKKTRVTTLEKDKERAIELLRAGI